MTHIPPRPNCQLQADIWAENNKRATESNWPRPKLAQFLQKAAHNAISDGHTAVWIQQEQIAALKANLAALNGYKVADGFFTFGVTFKSLPKSDIV